MSLALNYYWIKSQNDSIKYDNLNKKLQILNLLIF
ncbi:hypothetical protein [Campylobacter phage CP21]|uniref:Uncharacterized protein n=1 Tax=Campylobacter phage CP21 TaxID=2881391 RepID=I7JVY4_9CAUD|nr:hypothetical protein F421_gp229 [Campylobacter phage CP21]CCH63719.1 hypothetical protein [Campylobacter phage CP21]